MKFETYAEAKSLNKTIKCSISVDDESGEISSQYRLKDATNPKTKQKMRCIVLNEKAVKKLFGVKLTGNTAVPLNQRDWKMIKKQSLLFAKENKKRQSERRREENKKREQIRDQKIKTLSLKAQKTGVRQVLDHVCTNEYYRAIADEYDTYETTYVNADGSLTTE